MKSLETARSLLFAPGSDERKVTRALESGADAVIADLEDAVAVSAKTRARQVVASTLAAGAPCLRLVRVNALGTPWHKDDLRAVADIGVDAIVLPKAGSEAVHHVQSYGLPILAIVETARGLSQARQLACAPSVAALQLGAVDLGLALGLEPRVDGMELLVPRTTLVLASAVAGLRGPIDQVWLDVRDEVGLQRDCMLARSLGLRGKAAIHPAQVPVINAAFSPTEAEVQRARDVAAAYDRAVLQGEGVVGFDGEMVDLPVAVRARQILHDAYQDEAECGGPGKGQR